MRQLSYRTGAPHCIYPHVLNDSVAADTTDTKMFCTGSTWFGFSFTITLWQTNIVIAKMATEIVDLPTDSMVIFYSYASLPEGYMFFPQHSRWDLSFALRSLSSPHAAFFPTSSTLFRGWEECHQHALQLYESGLEFRLLVSNFICIQQICYKLG